MQQRDRYRERKGGSWMRGTCGVEKLSNSLRERERLTGGQWPIKVWHEGLQLLNVKEKKAKAKGIYSPVSRISKI